MQRDFVSISGITNLDELATVSKISREEGINFPVVIGYQASHKSIHEGTTNLRQPKFSALRDLSNATYDAGFITAIHYFTRDLSTVVEDLGKIGVSIRMHPRPLVQFNTLPPAVEHLREAKQFGFRPIFKVAVANKKTADGGTSIWKGEGVEDVSQGNPQTLVQQVIERQDWIDYAMFDPSHGTNHGLNLEESSLAIQFGRELRKQDLDHIGLIYAGGINPENVRGVIGRLTKEFPYGNFNIDTESGVRQVKREGDKLVEDRLDFDLVRTYLRESASHFSAPR